MEFHSADLEVLGMIEFRNRWARIPDFVLAREVSDLVSCFCLCIDSVNFAVVSGSLRGAALFLMCRGKLYLGSEVVIFGEIACVADPTFAVGRVFLFAEAIGIKRRAIGRN